MTRWLPLVLAGLGAPVIPPSAVGPAGYSPNYPIIARDFCLDGGGLCLSDAGSAGLPNDPGTPTFLYVLGDGGSDSYPCTQYDAGCVTFQGAIAKVRNIAQGPALRHPFIIRAGPGLWPYIGYVDGFLTQVGNYIPNADAGPYLAIEGTMVQASVGGLMSGTIASSTIGTSPWNGFSGPSAWSTVTVTGAGWTTNALANLPFCLTSGVASNGPCPVVYTNTSTVATLVGTWPVIQPANGDAFQIQTWGTFIDGGLPRAVGAAGLAGTMSPATYTTSVYVTGNEAPGYHTGWGSFGGFGSNPSFLAIPALNEPPIVIRNFAFTGGPNTTALAADGNENIGFINNYSSDINAVATGQTATSLVMGNVFSLSSAGGVAVIQQGIDDYGDTLGSGLMIAFGNSFTEVSSGGDSTCIQGGRVEVIQNSMKETDGQRTEFGLIFNQNGYILTQGNEYLGFTEAITDNFGESGAAIFMDSDEFDLNNEIIEVPRQSGATYHNGNAPVCNNNWHGFNVTQGGQLLLYGASIAGCGDAGDVQLNGKDFSYSFLTSQSPGVLIDKTQGISLVNQ